MCATQKTSQLWIRLHGCAFCPATNTSFALLRHFALDFPNFTGLTSRRSCLVTENCVLRHASSKCRSYSACPRNFVASAKYNNRQENRHYGAMPVEQEQIT